MNAKDASSALEVVNAIQRAYNHSGSTEELMTHANEEFFRVFANDREAMETMKRLCRMESKKGDVLGASDLGMKLESICRRILKEMGSYMPRVVSVFVEWPRVLVVESTKANERINVKLGLCDFENYPTEASVQRRREDLGLDS